MGSIMLRRGCDSKRYLYADDGIVPNSRLPAVIYGGSVWFSATDNPNDAMKHLGDLVEPNGWYVDWQGGVYRKVHYHSTAHEALVVYRGHATVELGGRRVGSTHTLSAGDVVFIPAGVGHRCVESTDNFLVFGLYPSKPTRQRWDRLWDWQKLHDHACRNIRRVLPPIADPFFGTEGPLLSYWR